MNIKCSLKTNHPIILITAFSFLLSLNCNPTNESKSLVAPPSKAKITTQHKEFTSSFFEFKVYNSKNTGEILIYGNNENEQENNFIKIRVQSDLKINKSTTCQTTTEEKTSQSCTVELITNKKIKISTSVNLNVRYQNGQIEGEFNAELISDDNPQHENISGSFHGPLKLKCLIQEESNPSQDSFLLDSNYSSVFCQDIRELNNF